MKHHPPQSTHLSKSRSRFTQRQNPSLDPHRKEPRSVVANHPFFEDEKRELRDSVPTYLKSLDTQWRGGWSWQWPMVIGSSKGEEDSILLSQLVISSLLSYKDPWHLLYLDIRGEFRPLKLFDKLKQRVGAKKARKHLHRIDKFRVLCWEDFVLLFKQQLIFRPDLALWVLAGWEKLREPSAFPAITTLLGEYANQEQRGLIITIREEKAKLLALMPWETIPFCAYIKRVSPPLAKDTDEANAPSKNNPPKTPSSSSPTGKKGHKRSSRHYYLEIYQNKELKYQHLLKLAGHLLKETSD